MKSNVIHHGPFLLGFGGRGQTVEELLPEHRWAHLKQTHSNKVVQQVIDTRVDQAGAEHQADAHFTFESGLGLVIKTADCLPILIAGRDFIAAIHAGWRGVESDIVAETLHELEKNRSSLQMSELHVWIGPHIRQQSFEVEVDVADRLIASAKTAELRRRHRGHASNPALEIHELAIVKTDPRKRWVDLEAIARLQLTSFGILNQNIESLGFDTFTDRTWSSYRRDGEKAGRNFSFISATW